MKQRGKKHVIEKVRTGASRWLNEVRAIKRKWLVGSRRSAGPAGG